MPYLMKPSEKRVNLSDNLFCIADVHIVIGVRDYDDVRSRHSTTEDVSPLGATGLIAPDQSIFAVRIVSGKAVPVV